jgi:hypothetical protein
VEHTPLRSCLIVVLLLLVNIAGCESRDEARRKQTADNLKQVRLAIDAYLETHAKSAGPGASKTGHEVSKVTLPKREATQGGDR